MRKRINRCLECKEPLKNIQTNQWMCDQNSSVCEKSLKVIYLNNPEAEEEWSSGYLCFFQLLYFMYLLILVLQRDETLNQTQPNCPVCNSTLFEVKAGLYCYNENCIQFKQKVVACCEGGFCWTKKQQTRK